jgi:hypothetical protein
MFNHSNNGPPSHIPQQQRAYFCEFPTILGESVQPILSEKQISKATKSMEEKFDFGNSLWRLDTYSDNNKASFSKF